MNKITLQNVTRKYVINKDEEFYAIRNISLIFNTCGFVSIVGRSGSGKSTIVNMIANLDKSSSGNVYFDDQEVTKLKGNKLCNYYKTKVGIVFQNYNLLESETALYNVMIAMQINGVPYKEAKNRAIKLLEYVGINKSSFDLNASLLSGGEKQRVAIARTLSNNPDVILCDEPTGALDNENSLKVMNLLKEYSKDKLVVMVSHNLLIVEKYSDRIIELGDGKIKSDRIIHKKKKLLDIKTKSTGKSSKWIDHLAFSNLKKRFKRNLLSGAALSISLILSFLTIGFINGKDQSIKEAAEKQLDFGVGTLSKEEAISQGTLLTLTRSTRPSLEDIENNQYFSQNFNIIPNFDTLMPINLDITYDEKKLENLYYYPIYSFDKNYVDNSLLQVGSYPLSDDLYEVVINDSCYQYLKNELGKDPLYEYLDLSYETEVTYVDFDDTYITDSFSYQRNVRIIGMVKELNYLQTPKIYYPYSALQSYLSDIILPNLSTYYDKEISWLDRVSECEDYDQLGSYSYRLFPKSRNYSYLYEPREFNDGLVYSSSSILIADSLNGFMQVAEYAIIMFLIITVVGSALILGIMSFTSYSEDHKKSAILTCLGASTSEISSIYLIESLLVGLFSILVSIALSNVFAPLINKIIGIFVDLNNLILPLTTFMGVQRLLPIFILIISMLLCALSTLIPIFFSKKIATKEELQSL